MWENTKPLHHQCRSGANTGQDTPLASVAPAPGHQVAHLMLWWQQFNRIKNEAGASEGFGPDGWSVWARKGLWTCRIRQSQRESAQKSPNKERRPANPGGICWLSLEEAIVSLWRLTAELAIRSWRKSIARTEAHSHVAVTLGHDPYVGKINCLNWSKIPSQQKRKEKRVTAWPNYLNYEWIKWANALPGGKKASCCAQFATFSDTDNTKRRFQKNGPASPKQWKSLM